MNHSRASSVSPLFIRIVVLTIALVGPVVVFDAMRVAFLDPLPFLSPENLITVDGVSQPRGRNFPEQLLDGSVVTEATYLQYGRATWSRPGGSRRIDVLMADAATLHVLGLAPARGRFFSREDQAHPGTALVSPDFWANEIGPGGGQEGHRLQLNGAEFDVIGVAPTALARLGRFDVVLPRRLDGGGLRTGKSPSPFDSLALARVRAGTPRSDVQRDMERIQRGQERPGQGGSRVAVHSLAGLMSDPAMPTLKTLAFSAAVLLLLAAGTIGMLAAMLASERLHEFAIRTALGASAARLRLDALRPWLVATLPAILCALALAVPLSNFTQSVLPTLGPMHSLTVPTVGLTVVIAALLAFVASVCTLIPQHLVGQLTQGVGVQAFVRRGALLGRVLATAQVALSVGLFCGALVAVRGLMDQTQRDLGIVSEGVQVIEMDLGEGRTAEQLREDWNRLTSGVSSSVADVTVGSTLPWASRSSWWMGSAAVPAGTFVGFTRVGSRFFDLLGMRFVEGADPFSSGALTSDVVISQEVARRLRLKTGDAIKVNSDFRRVAGVVNVVHDPTGNPFAVWPQAYLMAGADEDQQPSASLLIRGSPQEALRTRASVEAILPHASISQPAPLVGLLAERLQRQRLGAQVLAAYAALASLLVVLGLNGLMRRRVSQKMSEVGVRLVLGASPAQIDRTMLQAMLGPAVAGLILGVSLGFNLSETVAALMPWAKPLDASIYIFSALAGLAIILVSSWPALRVASRARPADLLRQS
ncbi:MAG: ABC transporter permease [Vicinamibacteria bacterium]